MISSFQKPSIEIEGRYKNEAFEIKESLETQFVQAKFPSIAMQKKWRIPSEFVCCPSSLSNKPIEDYYNGLIIGKIFNKTYYRDVTPSIQTIVDKVYVENNNAIIVFSCDLNSLKPYALSKIYLYEDKFIHESMGTFFSENGARKQFVLAQGLEWDGEDCIDDY